MKFFEGWFERTTSLLDLNAQLEMASAAYWMLWMSVLSCLLSFFAVVGLFLSLRQTRQAIRLTEKSADETREINQAQARAYLYVSTVSLNSDWYGCEINITNAGATPASQFYLRTECTITNGGSDSFVLKGAKRGFVWVHFVNAHDKHKERINFSEEEITDIERNTERVWASKRLFDSQSDTLRERLMLNISAKNKIRIFIHGTLLYSDIFGNWFQSDFRFCQNGNERLLERLSQPKSTIQKIKEDEALRLISC